MEETNQVEPGKETPNFGRGHLEVIPNRDTQIDELIDELRGINSDLWDLRWAVRHGADQNSSAIYSSARDLATALHAVRDTIEKTAFVPWYLRLWRGFGRMRVKRKFQKAVGKAEQQKELRRVHMQHLAENAGKLNYGRFRSRYS
jgi:ribosomal protein L29